MFRDLYDRMPVETRIAVRSRLPRGFLRWYAHQKADVYLVSYPKCGRTWLRLMIGRAIAVHFSLPQEEDILLLNWKKKPHPDLPMITVVHDDRPMLKTPDELERSKDRYRDKSVILLVRDPRDVVVSSYFEMSKRGRLFGKNPYESREAYFVGSLADFIHKKEGGFDTILAYYNIWAANRDIPKSFLLVRYEDMRENPRRELRRVVDFLGLEAISDQTVADAVEYTSFENMRRREAAGEFQSGILNPADKADADSFKARKGKVRGFVDYLSESQLQELNQKMQVELSDYFGYAP